MIDCKCECNCEKEVTEVACQGLSRGTEKEKRDRGNVRIKMCAASLGEMLTLCYIERASVCHRAEQTAR